jgi:hypothetical protein
LFFVFFFDRRIGGKPETQQFLHRAEENELLRVGVIAATEVWQSLFLIRCL